MEFGKVSGSVGPWIALWESGDSVEVVCLTVTVTLVSVASIVDIGVDGYTKDIASYSNGFVGYSNGVVGYLNGFAGYSSVR